MMAGQTASGKTYTTAEFVRHTLLSIFPASQAGQVGICSRNLVGCGPCMEPALISMPWCTQVAQCAAPVHVVPCWHPGD